MKTEVLKHSTVTETEVGRHRRLSRIIRPATGRTIIVPVDDSLIFGPANGLEEVDAKLAQILVEPPDAILAFGGVFRSSFHLLHDTALIVNITASTVRLQHTRKVQVSTVSQGLRLGAQAVAVHVNTTSDHELEMLQILGRAVDESQSCGMPVLAIMYPRKEINGRDHNYEELQQTDRKAYAHLVAHAVRVAADLGADIIKTKYTGDPDSFSTVVRACKPIPVVIAGGPVVSLEEMAQMAHGAITAGAAGVSFGRNIFSRGEPTIVLRALRAIVHDGRKPCSLLGELGASSC